MIFKKKIVGSFLLAFILFLGSLTGSAVTASASTDVSKQSAAATKAAVPKGVFSYPSKFSKTELTAELKPEAVKLMKIYAESILTGKVTNFNKYVDKHVAEKASGNFLLGRKYNKDRYKQTVTANRKANKRSTRDAYARDLKKVTSKGIKVYYSSKKSNVASFQYSYTPRGWDAFSIVYVSFNFTKQENGRYVLESLRIN
ncbi:hypothetical protein [Peribacillus glennii]|uniref:Uncharacterized protein n=1 Tax=Peribacillus glennii TaxID=2303991 RepID=A0A372L7N5_9BACI|nr:hypothetical protein [Peribacillus glennii]RFU61260.1 hypothetical protein D0466_18775 [Peribacillus glennii]